MKIISRIRQRPMVAKILTAIAILSALATAISVWLLADPSGLWFVIAFIIIAVTANIEDHEVKTFLFSGCLVTSRFCLRLAARINDTPAASHFDGTLSGHPSKNESPESPVLIADLLSILDQSIGKSVELEIPGYRVKATKVTAIDAFIEKHAGREDKPVEELKPWFARKG